MKALKFYKKEGENYIALNDVKSRLPLGLLLALGGFFLMVMSFLKNDMNLSGFLLLFIGLFILRTYQRNILINPQKETVTKFYSGWLNPSSMMKRYSFSQVVEICEGKESEVGLRVRKDTGRIKFVEIFSGLKDDQKKNLILDETRWLIKEKENEFSTKY